MFNEDVWFTDEGFPPPEHPSVMTMEWLRTEALKLFGGFIAARSGLNPTVETASLEDKEKFLSLQETENIVRAFSAKDNGEMMAVGGNTREEAEQQVRALITALVERVMSNVIAEGVKRDLIDVAFDTDADNFAFSVSDKGHQFVALNKDLFNDDGTPTEH